MKRVGGNLMEKIAHPDNLREAYLRAAQGKSTRPSVRTFSANLDTNLSLMRRQLLSGSFRFGDYRFFTVYDPKRREICAASFPERVAFHAMMRICHPVFDDYQVFDSFASRIGKGTYAALERARRFAGRFHWFAKLDVVKYFDSLDHEVLKKQLHRLFKDRMLLDYFDGLIDGYQGAGIGQGVPIGNLTSQYFANHYLSPADHYAKQALRVPGLVRYMDDVLLFHDDKSVLNSMVKDYTHFVHNHLHLNHHPVVMNECCRGIPFLGYVVRGTGLRLNLRSKRRFSAKMRNLTADFQDGKMDQEQYAMRAGCLLAFTDKADCVGFRRKLAQSAGMYPQGL